MTNPVILSRTPPRPMLRLYQRGGHDCSRSAFSWVQSRYCLDIDFFVTHIVSRSSGHGICSHVLATQPSGGFAVPMTWVKRSHPVPSPFRCMIAFRWIETVSAPSVRKAKLERECRTSCARRSLSATILSRRTSIDGIRISGFISLAVNVVIAYVVAVLG